jgi:transcriptional regulator with XRE-family HTH domain
MLRRLRETREAQGRTQREVAEALGRPVSYVSKCELAERRMDPIDLLQFARVYGEPITHFLPNEVSG